MNNNGSRCYSELDLEFLRQNLDQSNAWLALRMGRSVESIKQKKYMLKMKKEYIPNQTKINENSTHIYK